MISVLPPPPSAPRSDNSCLKWGAITCGGLGLLGIIAIFIGFKYVMQSPMVKQAMTSTLQAQAAVTQLPKVGQALDRYVADKKKYPDQLKDLIPAYLPDERSLHVQPDPRSPRIWYKKPVKNAPPETILLKTEIASPVPLAGAPAWGISLRKDGQLEGTRYVYVDPNGGKIEIDARGFRN
jgi:hypothetical protein